MRISWSEEQIEMLRRDWLPVPTPDLAKALGRSRNAVIGMAHRLGLPRKPTKGGRRFVSGPRKAPKPRKPRRQKVIHRIPEPEPEPFAPVPLLEAKGFQCRAIIDDMKDDDGLAVVCGKRIVGGQAFSFCSEHLKLFTTQGGYRNVRVEPIIQQLQSNKR